MVWLVDAVDLSTPVEDRVKTIFGHAGTVVPIALVSSAPHDRLSCVLNSSCGETHRF